MAKENESSSLGCGGVSLIVAFVLMWKIFEYSDKPPIPDQPVNIQSGPESRVVNPPMFQVKYEIQSGKNIWGVFETWRAYALQNVGEQAERIKWVAINNREECLAVPILANDGKVYSLDVLSGSYPTDVADYLLLEIGQAIPLKMPPNCGDPIRLKVGTDRGEYDIGPLTFY